MRQNVALLKGKKKLLNIFLTKKYFLDFLLSWVELAVVDWKQLVEISLAGEPVPPVGNFFPVRQGILAHPIERSAQLLNFVVVTRIVVDMVVEKLEGQLTGLKL